MLRKVLLTLGLLLLSSAHAFSQSTTVSGTITDAGAQTWNNGTFNFVFVPSPANPVGPYTWTGGTLPTNFGGSLSGTGTYSVSIPSNTAISPIQSQWTATFCPQASSGCFTVSNITITGATQTLNATPPAILINLQSTQPPVLAYTDSEVTGAALGSTYFNLVSTSTKTCTAISGNSCTTWVVPGGTANNLAGPGTITGSFSGTHTESGVVTFSNPSSTFAGNAATATSATSATSATTATNLTGPGAITGTFSGNPTLSGNPTVSGTLSANGGGALNGAFTGPTTLSGNVTQTAGQNIIVSYSLNGTQIVDGNKYTTIQAAITGAQALGAAAQGCPEVHVPVGYSETISPPLIIGTSGGACITLTIDRSAQLTFTGNHSGVDMIELYKNSTISCDGINTGGTGTGGWQVTSTLVANSIIASYPRTGAEWTGYLRGCTIQGSPSATIANAVIDTNNMTSSSRIQEMVLGGFANTNGIRITNTGAGSTVGPINLDNNYVNLAGTGTEEPLLISSAQCCVVNVNVNGGTYNHAGPGKANIDIQATGTNQVGGVKLDGVYMEFNSAGEIGVNVNNGNNVAIRNGFFGCISGASATIGMKIAETVAAGTNTVTMDNSYSGCGASMSEIISDTIHSPTVNIVGPKVNHYSSLSCCGTQDDTFDVYSQNDLLAYGLPLFRIIQSNKGGIEIPKLGLQEIAAPTGIASQDVCYGDSTAHALKCSYNNGAFGQVPLGGANLLISPTAPTIAAAGCGGSAAAISAPNGTASFNIFTGTAPTSGGCTVTMPAATTDWHCEANHVSAISTTNFIIQQTGALSTTSVTLQLFSDVAAATAPTASDTWRVTCTAN
jgi:hypothetical protein